MRVLHKFIGCQVGKADRKLFEYEQAIEALSDEETLENMVEERLKRSSNPSFYYLRAVSIGVLLENLRRAKNNLTSEVNNWGIYQGFNHYDLDQRPK